MAISIHEKMFDPREDIYYNTEFRRFLESYMHYLRTNSKTQVETIDPHNAYKYEGDFYGLLQVMGVAPNLHWLVMRVNDLTNPSESDETLTEILLPDGPTIARLSQFYQSMIRKKESKSLN